MKIHRALRCASAIVLAAGAASAPAADNAKFDRLDRNHDGVITRDETRQIKDYARAFIEADANKDGKLDRDEFVTAESIHDRIVTGKYVADAVITAKVKAALIKEPDLQSLDVSVETQRGEVLLSGFVHDDRQRRKAMKAALAVNGVAAVKDAMLVR